MNADRKKQLKDAYKAKPVVGGIYCIRCSGNGRAYIQPSVDIEGLQNRYRFAIDMGTSPDPSLRGEWEKYGSSSFSFTVLDRLEKKADQSQAEFADDVRALYEIWLEREKAGEPV